MPISEKKIVFDIPRKLVDSRFDVALLALVRERYPGMIFSRNAAADLIRMGKATLSGVSSRPDYLVRLHDVAELFERDLSLKEQSLDDGIVPEETIPVLFQDKYLIAVDKPAGIQTHPAGNVVRETLAHWVISRYPEVRGVGENALRPGIVHRLDRETSGVLVIARTNEAFDALKDVFQERMAEKTYITLVYGHMPEREGIISKPLMQRSGELKRFVVETATVPETAREAVTLYRVLARYEEFDLLEVKPKTGRTHQIRAHMASLGCPVVGDKVYAFKPMRRKEKLFPARQMLHAHRLTFALFSKRYAFEAPLPGDFRNTLRDIDETRIAGYDDEALKSLLSE